MTREEILNLSKMSELEQRRFLLRNGALKQTIQEFAGSEPRALVYYESLPDLADRLFGSGKGIRVSHMIEIYIAQTGNAAPDKDVEYALFWRWWAMDALSINRIQAALLAKEFQK